MQYCENSVAVWLCGCGGSTSYVVKGKWGPLPFVCDRPVVFSTDVIAQAREAPAEKSDLFYFLDGLCFPPHNRQQLGCQHPTEDIGAEHQHEGSREITEGSLRLPPVVGVPASTKSRGAIRFRRMQQFLDTGDGRMHQATSLWRGEEDEEKRGRFVQVE